MYNLKCIFVVYNIYHTFSYEVMALRLAMIPFLCHFVPLCVVSEGIPLFHCQLPCLSVCLF